MNQVSPLDGYREQIEEWFAERKYYRQIASLLVLQGVDTSERSLRRAVRRWGLVAGGAPFSFKSAGFATPSFQCDGDQAQITSDPRAWKDYLNGVDELLRERGLDPGDWDVERLRVAEWDSPTGETLKQLRVNVKRKRVLSMIIPARVPLKQTWRPGPYSSSSTEPELVVFVSDQHCPNHDPELHKRFCQFIHDQVPERGYLLGDTIDLPTISRHPAEPEWAQTTQECVDAGGQLLLDIRQASDVTVWRKLPGNHEERLRRVIIDRLGDWYGLTPAQIEGLPDLPPIYDPVYLLRLDELGIEYVRPKGKYDHGQLKVTQHLAARHGWVARKGSGSSALATLDHLGHSAVVGHTHRQSIVHQTKHDIDSRTSTRVAAEIGCMCRITEGLGYTPAPDWQQGFATAALWPDGTFKLDLATYVHNHLYWRSERY